MANLRFLLFYWRQIRIVFLPTTTKFHTNSIYIYCNMPELFPASQRHFFIHQEQTKSFRFRDHSPTVRIFRNFYMWAEVMETLNLIPGTNNAT